MVSIKEEKLHETRNVVLGDTEGNNVLCVDMSVPNANKNLLVLGGSGSGKSSCYSAPLIMQAMKRDESIVVLDPKGELFDRFFAPLDNAGYTCIRRFDLAEPKEEWVGWNFIKSAGNTVESAYQVADTICDSINLPESYNIQTGARYLLSAIMLIANDCDEDDDMRSSVYILQDMLSSPDIAHNVRCFYQNNDGEVIDALGMVVRLSDADIEGTAYALMNGLRHLWNTDIMEILSSGDIDTALPANDKCAYFVQMPYDWNHPLDFMSALFFSDLLQNCFAEAAKTENGRCKVPVNIIFDDFSYAGNIANFARSIKQANAANININIITNHIGDIKRLYPHSWQDIVSACGVWVCTAITDPETAQAFLERMPKEVKAPVEAGYVIHPDSYEVVDETLVLRGLVEVNDIKDLMVQMYAHILAIQPGEDANILKPCHYTEMQFFDNAN